MLMECKTILKFPNVRLILLFFVVVVKIHLQVFIQLLKVLFLF